MIKKIYDMFRPVNYYLGLSSIVLFMFLFPFSHTDSTEESEHCFEQHTHFDSIFEKWRRIQHQDGSYSYEYGYRYAYNYHYSYRYNLDKCIAPLPAPYPPNQAPIQPPLPHDGNPYPTP